MPLALMTSLSRKERPLKHQQVPLLFWFLTGVIGFSFTVVKVKSFALTGLGARWAWAPEKAATTRARDRIHFFIL